MAGRDFIAEKDGDSRMAEYDSFKAKQERQEKRKQLKETYYRLTAPVHITLNSYKEHERIEGYYEFKDYGRIFQCDRLLKLETIYGKVQMGYNPNRMRSFVFANMKTNLYDTVNSRYQKIMKEYQQKPEQKRGNENRAYVSGRWKSAAVLLEKAENKPWSEKSIKPYLRKTNMDAIQKTMPFFYREQEREQLEKTKEQIKGLQESVRQNALQGKHQENKALNEQMRELQEESNMLQSILYRKDSGRRGFIRKMNYAFDIEKHEMFDYYRQKRLRAMKEEVEAMETGAENSESTPDGEKEREQ